MEVTDTQTGLVWMSVEVVTQQDFDNLQLDAPFRPVGIAASRMDAALFRYSPNFEGDRCVSV